jgi:peptidoglycan hydrolase-like protein with peptidoglycan-binding domain
MDEIFANSEYSGYSEAGRAHVVYQAQKKLKLGADGVPGKGTYNAIQKFQSEHDLPPTGQLDSATLAALELAEAPDDSTWSAPKIYRRQTAEADKTKLRKLFERKVLGGRDLKDIFRR